MAVIESDSFGTEIDARRGEAGCCCRSPSATPTTSTCRSSGAVIAVYGDDRRARVVLTVWPADEVLVHKMSAPAPSRRWSTSAGEAGVWISGVPHPVFYLDGGLEHGLDGNLAGNVLVWQEGARPTGWSRA